MIFTPPYSYEVAMEKQRHLKRSDYQYLPQTTHVTPYRDIRTNVRSPTRRTIDQRTTWRPKPSTRTSTERHVTFQITPHENLPPAHDPMFKILPHRPQTVKEKQPATSQQRIEELMQDNGRLRQKLARSESTIDALIMFHQCVEKSCQTLKLSLKEPSKELRYQHQHSAF